MMASEDAISNLRLDSQREFRFASPNVARTILGTSDEYRRQLSAVERRVRLRSEGEISQGDYLAFAAGSVRRWTAHEAANASAGLDNVRVGLSRFASLLPDTIWLAITSGEEEGGAGYTRGHVIVLPPAKLAHSPDQFGPSPHMRSST